jgi:cytochrome c-type biogenesis protein CcmH
VSRVAGWARGRVGAALALLALAGPLAAQSQNPNVGFRKFEQQNIQNTATVRDTVNRLMVPGAVQERAVTTARDDDSLVQALEHKIRCTCGCSLDVFTCRTTDFTCATSPAMHRLVMARLDSSMTAEQVIAAFQRQYGESIMMQPPRHGFNWTAYVMPFVALGVGIWLVAWLMRRWIRSAPKTPIESEGAAPPPATVEAQDEELERLKRELEKFEA